MVNKYQTCQDVKLNLLRKVPDLFEKSEMDSFQITST